MDDAAFARLLEAEERSFWFRARRRLLVATLDRHFPYATSFLEVGCGNGHVLAGVAAQHPQMRVAGTDLSAAGLAHARQRVPRAELLQADARELPFTAEFDVVGAFDIVEHVADDRRVLGAMRAAVRPGGGMIVSVPQHPWLWSEADRFSGHQRRYTRRELQRKLTDAGLHVRAMTSFVTFPLPLMAASRAWERVSRKPYDPARELALPARVDRVLERVLDAEAALIARGASLPVGGSLLAVARCA
ncbi:MAG TPA: class I SAM-dependent methyltransferase [Solirubrobacteraceae bacterium]